MTRRHRVLVVDSDIDALYYVDDLLRELGCQPVMLSSVPDVDQAIIAARTHAMIVSFDAVLGESRQALDQLATHGNEMPVMIMAPPAVRPDGDLMPSRYFLEHPPDLGGLADALESCFGAPSEGDGR